LVHCDLLFRNGAGKIEAESSIGRGVGQPGVIGPDPRPNTLCLNYAPTSQQEQAADPNFHFYPGHFCSIRTDEKKRSSTLGSVFSVSRNTVTTNLRVDVTKIRVRPLTFVSLPVTEHSRAGMAPPVSGWHSPSTNFRAARFFVRIMAERSPVCWAFKPIWLE